MIIIIIILWLFEHRPKPYRATTRHIRPKWHPITLVQCYFLVKRSALYKESGTQMFCIGPLPLSLCYANPMTSTTGPLLRKTRDTLNDSLLFLTHTEMHTCYTHTHTHTTNVDQLFVRNPLFFFPSASVFLSWLASQFPLFVEVSDRCCPWC